MGDDFIFVDLLIKNIEVFNSYYKKFINADVSVLNGKIYYIDKNKNKLYNPKKIIDGTGRFLIPGFIDIHMHIESSMMTPMTFCKKLAEYGVTTIVSEPHEMGNVAGIDGVKEMINAGKSSIIDVYYGIPSSVPSTSEDLETTGGVINFTEMKELLDNKNVICVGEIMNYSKIIKENNLEITKFLNYIHKIYPNYVIEGHCPKLLDLDLAKFLYLGINGDHTEHNLEELIARFENGMFIEIQHKMVKREILDYIKENKLFEHFCFVTDDVMADKFYEEGHLNVIIKTAIELGFSKEDAIYATTFTPAKRMNLSDRGSIAPGKLADFIILDNVETLHILSTYKNGNIIYDYKDKQIKRTNNYQFPKSFYESVKLKNLSINNFDVFVKEDVTQVKVRVINVKNGGTQTKETFIICDVKNHHLLWEKTDCLLAMVFERYGKNGNISFGLVSGDCIKHGAVASTYAHDHHNLLVVGKNVYDMLLAANKVIDLQGGIVVTNGNEIKAQLQLNVGGILSDSTVEEIGLSLKSVRNCLIEQGYNHYNPIMSLCTLTLPVSPELKITDKGLIHVETGNIFPLYSII